MLKNAKKIIAVICITGFILACFAGCGNSEKNQSADGVTEVNVWASDKGAKSAMVSLVDEYNNTVGKKDGIKINYKMLDGDFNQQIELALQTGSCADIFPTSKMEEQALNGQLQAINELEGGEEFIKHFADKMDLTKFYVNGKAYSTPNKAITCGLLYNKDMFIAAGIVDENGEAKPPVTYDELREYAKLLTNPEKKQYGIIFPGKSSSFFPYEVQYPMMSSVGHDGFDPVSNKYDYSKLKPIFEKFLEIKEDGSCYPGTEAIDADPARARFAEGNIGMKFGMSWDVGVLTDQFPAKCSWGVAPLPVLDANSVYKQKMEVYKGYVMAKIPEDKDADKIFKVYKWLCGDELQVELYERGINLPWDFSILEGKEFDNLNENWVAFAELVKISAVPPLSIKSDTSGETSLAAMFMSDVWNGDKSSIDGVLKKWSDTCNEGIERYKQNNPEYVPDLSGNDNLDLRR